eukprot:1160368-Pelagomonas_calceolata.AAC.3
MFASLLACWHAECQGSPFSARFVDGRCVRKHKRVSMGAACLIPYTQWCLGMQHVCIKAGPVEGEWMHDCRECLYGGSMPFTLHPLVPGDAVCLSASRPVLWKEHGCMTAERTCRGNVHTALMPVAAACTQCPHMDIHHDSKNRSGRYSSHPERQGMGAPTPGIGLSVAAMETLKEMLLVHMHTHSG